MLQLNEKFLEEIGLKDLPDAQKKPFLQHVYDELELRVGTKLSDNLSEDQLHEFESIIDRKDDIVAVWLSKNVPDYQDDSIFKQLQLSSQANASDPNLQAEYAATKWLELNRPDYRKVVTQVLDDLKQEIIASRDIILDNH